MVSRLIERVLHLRLNCVQTLFDRFVFQGESPLPLLFIFQEGSVHVRFSQRFASYAAAIGSIRISVTV